MKEIKSKVQPNHLECSVWVDLNEDPHGSIKKHWNGKEWVKSTNNNADKLITDIENIKESVKALFIQLADLKALVNNIKQYDDTKIHERINKLINRVNKLEQSIITE